VHAGAVADDDVQRIETAQAVRREQPQQRMDTEPLTRSGEVGDRADRVGTDEHARICPPQRHLLPEAVRLHRQERERADRLPRYDPVRDVEARRDRRAVALVPVEELDHPARLSQ